MQLARLTRQPGTAAARSIRRWEWGASALAMILGGNLDEVGMAV